MDTKKTDKYANYRYQIVHPDEMREAQWLISQGDFKDLDDYIECTTRAEIRIMKRIDAEKAYKAKLRKKRREERKKIA